MGSSSFFGLKVYRNVYVKDYNKFPYQLLKGRNTLMYRGRIICGVENPPKEFDPKKDIFISCSCDFDKYKNLRRIV